jgi:hypothetical protein
VINELRFQHHPNRAMLGAERIDFVCMKGFSPINQPGGDDVYASS